MEQVTVLAADHDVAADPVSARSRRYRADNHQNQGGHERASAHTVLATAAGPENQLGEHPAQSSRPDRATASSRAPGVWGRATPSE